jgi:hypothetical protein
MKKDEPTSANRSRKPSGFTMIFLIAAAVILAAVVVTTPKVSGGDATKFPTFSAQTLSGQAVTFPAVTAGKRSILFVAFEPNAQPQIDSWAAPFILKYIDTPGIAYFEIPMISDVYRPVSGFIDGGMRAGVPKGLHAKTATFYGNRDQFFNALNITDVSQAYLFILDESGTIIHREQGAYSEAKALAAASALNK